MKAKIFPIFLIITFSIIFYVFYKGLQNSNIYTPEIKSEIKIPSFEAKEFFSKDTINSDQIFIESEFYLLNIWASWCIPCKEEHKYLMDLSKKENIKIILILDIIHCHKFVSEYICCNICFTSNNIWLIIYS